MARIKQLYSGAAVSVV